MPNAEAVIRTFATTLPMTFATTSAILRASPLYPVAAFSFEIAVRLAVRCLIRLRASRRASSDEAESNDCA